MITHVTVRQYAPGSEDYLCYEDYIMGSWRPDCYECGRTRLEVVDTDRITCCEGDTQ
jgi:hypothetical protein